MAFSLQQQDVKLTCLPCDLVVLCGQVVSQWYARQPIIDCAVLLCGPVVTGHTEMTGPQVGECAGAPRAL